MTKGLPRGVWLRVICCMAAVGAGARLVAQDAAAWQARLAADDATARQALGGLPPALEAECAVAVAALLERADAALRNEAVAWLLARPQVADRVLPKVLVLRGSEDHQVARAAGPLVSFFARHRPLSLESLRELLQQPGRIHEVVERLAEAPDLELQLLPDLLAVNPLMNVDQAMRRLSAREPQRLAAELRLALVRPGDGNAQLQLLARLGPIDADSLQLLDRRLGVASLERPTSILEVMTQGVLQGATPPPNWLALLRGQGDGLLRAEILRALGGHALSGVLRSEVASMPPSQAAVRFWLDQGRTAVDHKQALLRVMEHAEPENLAGLAEAAAQLAPATRACAIPLLPHLCSEHQGTVQLALFALGELGNDANEVRDAVAACLTHADQELRLDALVALARLGLGSYRPEIEALVQDGAPEQRSLATFVLASAIDGESSVDGWLREAGGTDLRRALVATAALDRCAVTADQLLPLLEREGRTSGWANSWMRRSLVSSIVRTLVRRPLSARSLEMLKGVTQLTVQDNVRVYDWLLREQSPELAASVTEFLFARIQWTGNEGRVLEAIAARGKDAVALAPRIQVFVLHPELGVREAAIACLQAIAGDRAPAWIAAAQQEHDPWPAWLSQQKQLVPSLAAAFVRDAKNPVWMRAHLLRGLALRSERANDWVDLLDLLLDSDTDLAVAAGDFAVRHPELWMTRGPEGVGTIRDERVLRAFVGGIVDLRTALGGALRNALQEPWPMALIGRVLELPAAASGFSPDGRFVWDRNGLTQLATRQLRDQGLLLPSDWYRKQLDCVPAFAMRVLLDGAGTPAPELLPQLHALAEKPQFAWLGQQVLLRAEPTSPGGDLAALSKLVTTATQQVRAGKAVESLDLRALDNLPWRERPEALAPLAEQIAELWHAVPATQRDGLFQLVSRMGPLAGFAVPDFAAQLTAQSVRGEIVAQSLIDLGRQDLVRTWLQQLPPERWSGMHNPEVARLAAECAAEHFAARFVEAPDAALPALWRELSRGLPGLSAADRDAVAIRLLAYREANPAGSWVGSLVDLGPSLGDAARTNFAAFLARRKALPQRPDPLAEAVVCETFPALPELGTAAMRDGLVRVVAVLGAMQANAVSPDLVKVANELIDIVDACGERADVSRGLLPVPGTTDPYLGHLLGNLFARAGVAPVDAVVKKLADAPSREFALALLGELGGAAQGASLAVAALAADATQVERVQVMQVLVRLGVPGTEQACRLAEKDPELRPLLFAVVADGDDARRLTAARWLATQPSLEADRLLPALQQGLRRSKDAPTRAALTLLLLQQKNRVLVAKDWLGIASIEPAILRQRAVQALADRADGALPCGVLAELLDDVDGGVRTAAVTALLAQPERVALCRRPLEEFAAKAEPEVAARIRAALAAAK
jgi:hypothetical protein